MENVLIVDVETTGLNPESCTTIEIAAVLYSIKHKSILQNASTLLECQENKAEHINGINVDMTNTLMPFMSVIDLICEMANFSNAIVAHNAQFDRGFIKLIPQLHNLSNKKWICTRDDFNWPFILNRKRLKDICNASGVIYDKAHRALADCNFIASCFTKLNDLDIRMEMALNKSNYGKSTGYF